MKTFRLVPSTAGLVAAARLFMTSAIVLAGSAAEAGAMDTSPPTIRVRYDDLDLASPYDVETLRRRVRSAAEQVCGTFSSKELAREAVYNLCVDQATKRGLEKIGLASR